eukprot:COSAG02_NODE_56521_length_285_cov_0.817204_1_plen_26_part_01
MAGVASFSAVQLAEEGDLAGLAGLVS